MHIHLKSRYIVAAATFGLLAVVLGAFGAHALEARLEALGTSGTWQTAVDYQMWHALALLLLAVSGLDGRTVKVSAACFCVGVLLFSGSLYWLALDGPRWLGPITPLGGLSLMVGWGGIIVAAVKKRARG